MKNQLFTFLMCLFTSVLIAQVSAKEKQALVDLYLATNGENWVNTWQLNTPVSEWYGITVEKNKVTGIDLLFNNINGTLPASIGNFENLKLLELSFNKLSGTIPMELGRLSKLELLALNGNNLSGGIPASIGNLKSLKQLHLSSNQLQGIIPTELGNLSSLEVLNVFHNKLSGTLPMKLSHSKNLKKLVIAKNDLIQTEAFSSVQFFKNDQIFQTKNGIRPSSKTVIASETSEDN